MLASTLLSAAATALFFFAPVSAAPLDRRDVSVTISELTTVITQSQTTIKGVVDAMPQTVTLDNYQDYLTKLDTVHTAFLDFKTKVTAIDVSSLSVDVNLGGNVDDLMTVVTGVYSMVGSCMEVVENADAAVVAKVQVKVQAVAVDLLTTAASLHVVITAVVGAAVDVVGVAVGASVGVAINAMGLLSGTIACMFKLIAALHVSVNASISISA